MDPKAFLDTVLSLIRDNYPGDSARGLPAANIGLLVKSRSGLDWTQFGYPKLSSVLAELENRGLIKVDYNPKHALTVWLMDESISATNEVMPSDTSSQPEWLTGPFQRLRPPVWHAFVNKAPTGRRLLNKSTGAVWLLPDEPPGQASEWVTVDAIDEDTQKGWARDFLQEKGLQDNTQLTSRLDWPNWYKSFPDELAKNEARLVSEWNRLRSHHVQLNVEGWCSRNGVSHDVVFQAWAESQIRKPAKSEDLRQLLISAVSKMSTDELLSINVPAKYLLQVLRPDLLSQRS